jgi:hypothetical protein
MLNTADFASGNICQRIHSHGVERFLRPADFFEQPVARRSANAHQ